MKVRLFTIFVITSLLLSFQLQTIHAVDKVGATCTMVGSKSVVGNTTLSCIKSGDKLVWAKLTDPTPKPSPTPTCPDGSCGNPNISVPLNPTEISKLKKEIEALKAKYNQTKDAKEKDSITKRIDELARKLESLNNTPAQSKPKTEQAPTTGATQDEVATIKKEIEALKAKYNQTKDAKEKESITTRVDELTRKLESLRSTPSKPRIDGVDAEETAIMKEIEALKTKYNKTKDPKEKKSINKRINELMSQLKSDKTKIILREQSD